MIPTVHPRNLDRAVRMHSYFQPSCKWSLHYQLIVLAGFCNRMAWRTCTGVRTCDPLASDSQSWEQANPKVLTGHEKVIAELVSFDVRARNSTFRVY